MTPKARSVFRCTNCGAEHSRWSGRCDVCGEWNTLVEEVVAKTAAVGKGGGAARRIGGHKSLAEGGSIAEPQKLREVSGTADQRWKTGLAEFDFALGGGIVPGSMILIGGEPGIGKSTLLLQVAAKLESSGRGTLYVSGEESALQVRMRAERLSDSAIDVNFLGETLLETILATASSLAPSVLVVDSIQTVFTADLEGAPGSVGQVRECAARLMRFAKETGITVFVVGHVTRDGGIAGPKTLEHIVDTVLYFEGEGTLDHRILRAMKNRFGSVDEIGVFRMTESGLDPVENPSELFLGDRDNHASGSAVTALLEGSRPMLIEIQGLAAKSGFGNPQRVATGYRSVIRHVTTRCRTTRCRRSVGADPSRRATEPRICMTSTPPIERIETDAPLQEPRLWRDNGWTARVIKNEDDEGWAVEMVKHGEPEPVLVGPWTMGRDKKNPKPLDNAAFNTLVKTAAEVLRRHEQQLHAQLHKSLVVSAARGRVTVTLDIVADEDDPYAVLSAVDEAGEALAQVRAAADFRLTAATASAWIAADFRKPD